MKINQIATALNNTFNKQQIGLSAVVNEDLSNIIDIGKEIIATDTFGAENFDSFTRDLIDQVGKIMFVDRTYTSQAPNILKDGWEYGSILEKVRCELPDAQDNATWDLFNYPKSGGAAYPDPFELSKPDVKAKFFNSKTTYEVPITLTVDQVKEAFQSAAQMSSFIAMIENRIAMKMTLCNDALIMATIANLMGQKFRLGANVNLLALYKTNFPSATVTAATALTDKEFLRFASKTIAQYKKYLATASKLYNGDGDSSYLTFTPADRLKFIANTEFSKSLDAYLYSDTYHNEFVNLPGYEEVAFWQGTGTSNDERLSIDVTVDDGSTGTEIKRDGVVAVMFDDEAAAVCNQNYRVTSIYNPRGEYTNYFYKWDAMYMNDLLENCVVFDISDYANAETFTGDSAPNNWNTVYAVANSAYYIADANGTVTINGEKFKQLSASDKTTETGFSWANYKGKAIVKKIA